MVGEPEVLLQVDRKVNQPKRWSQKCYVKRMTYIITGAFTCFSFYEFWVKYKGKVS